MKKKAMAAFLAASFMALASCDQTPKTTADNPLVGQWKIDSIATADNNLIGVLLLASTLNDSAAFDVVFTADSFTLHQKDTITKSGYTFDPNTNQLLLEEDSSVLSFQPIDSTYIKLTGKDSTSVFLRRK